MEKIIDRNIQMSLETARKLYVMIKPSVENDSNIVDLKDSILMDVLLATFTKEELEGSKGFTWENSYGKNVSWQIHCGKVQEAFHDGLYARERYKTKEQAESALALAQLSFIVAKYNEGKVEPEYFYIIDLNMDGSVGLGQECGKNLLGICFHTEEDAVISLEVNKELWEQYWMAKK